MLYTMTTITNTYVQTVGRDPLYLAVLKDHLKAQPFTKPEVSIKTVGK